MHNIQEIAAYLRQKTVPMTATSSLLCQPKTAAAALLSTNSTGHYVPNSVTYDFVDDSSLLYSAGYAFGQFQSMLADLPMDRL